MKLYTEEQVKLMIEKSRYTGLTAEFLIIATPPIELPSDEEIEEESSKWRAPSQAFRGGAKWMKEKILNQNK
jgi:hypothetical protein